MKDRKFKGLHKVLLMSIAVVLVAALSVSATLAYLTAKTNQAVNTFKATESLKGEVVEDFPGTADGSVENQFNYSTRPNEVVTKAPRIDNDSPHEKEMYVGAKVEFIIMTTSDGRNYTETPVDYATFSKFVKVVGLPTNTTLPAEATGETAGVWTDVTPDLSTAKYYIYNKKLAKDDGDSGEAAKSGTDTSANIFNTVQIDKKIQLDSTNGVNLTTDLVNKLKDTPNAGNGEVAFSATKLKKFEYKIKITGYGTEAGDTVTFADAVTELKSNRLMSIA